MSIIAPKLSIITVNLNNADGLKKTLNSVACQTFTDYEHLIIDGGSTDGSVDIIKKYEAKYNGTKDGLFWVSEPDKGIYNAMNKGIKEAKGEYCLFLNSGDYLSSANIITSISKELNSFEILYGDLIHEFRDGKTNFVTYPDKVGIGFLSYGALGHPSMFFKRNLFLEYGVYDENLKIVSDWSFYTKAILIHNVTYKHIEAIITVFNKEGISNDIKYLNLHNNELNFAKNSMFPFNIWKETSLLTIEKNKYKSELRGLKSSRIIQIAMYIINIKNKLLSYIKYSC